MRTRVLTMLIILAAGGRAAADDSHPGEVLDKRLCLLGQPQGERCDLHLPPLQAPTSPAPGMFTLFGQTYCLPEAITAARCDVWVIPPGTPAGSATFIRPAGAGLIERLVRWLRKLTDAELPPPRPAARAMPAS
jgi:hypothetical protein